jgi:hypothetical protein
MRATYRSTNEGDVFDFHVEVDGQPVAPHFNAYALLGQRDVTSLLNKYHMPLLDESTRPLLGKDAMNELLGANVLLDDDGHHPNWIVRAAYHWDQIFPAGRDTQITHYYRPVLGGSYLSNKIDIAAHDPMKDAYCPDQTFAKALRKMPRSYETSPMLLERDLEYILSTGANWAGPIGHFHLELDKSDSDLVSLCPIPGLHLVPKGHSFVGDAERYTPTTNIKVMFVWGNPYGHPSGP